MTTTRLVCLLGTALLLLAGAARGRPEPSRMDGSSSDPDGTTLEKVDADPLSAFLLRPQVQFSHEFPHHLTPLELQPGQNKRLSEFLGGPGKKRLSEFLGGPGKKRMMLLQQDKRLSEFLGGPGKKRLSEFLGGPGKRSLSYLRYFDDWTPSGESKRLSEFLGGPGKRLNIPYNDPTGSEFLGGPGKR